MSFESANFKSDRANIFAAGLATAPAFHRYGSTTDTLATILASAYFNDLQNTDSGGLSQTQILVGDLIAVKASDDVQIIKVTAISPNITTTQFSEIVDDGSITNAKISASAAIAFSKLAALSSTNILVGNGSNVATAVAMSGDATLSNAGVLTVANDAITTVKILNANVTLAKLAAGITPSHVVKFAGKHSYGGGGTTTQASVPGVVAGDIVIASIQGSTNTVALGKAAPGTDVIDFTFSADPGAATVVSYSVLRAAS